MSVELLLIGIPRLFFLQYWLFSISKDTKIFTLPNFEKYPLSNKFYGGSEKKIGIVMNGNDYMVKFQKKTAFGVRNNHISEYLGSHIFSMLDFPA